VIVVMYLGKVVETATKRAPSHPAPAPLHAGALFCRPPFASRWTARGDHSQRRDTDPHSIHRQAAAFTLAVRSPSHLFRSGSRAAIPTSGSSSRLPFVL